MTFLMESVIKLDWDSRFFGYGVARICCRNMDDKSLSSVLDRLWKNDIVLVYWASDPLDLVSQNAAANSHGRLVDKKSRYLLTVPNGSPRLVQQGDVVEYTSMNVDCDLLDLAIQSGQFSRFRVDSRIGHEKWASLYRVWIENSARRKIADMVLVKRKAGQVVGMVTLAMVEKRGRIGLLGVNEEFRGQGIGRQLVQNALAWFVGMGAEQVEVVTQGDNVAACRLYESCGFVLQDVDYFYHFWSPTT